jgi:UDP-N-acetylmuramyl pentapeptide synthase
MVPVGVVQVGCVVTDAVGATGAVGKTSTVKLLAELVQPVAVFLTVTG